MPLFYFSLLCHRRAARCRFTLLLFAFASREQLLLSLAQGITRPLRALRRFHAATPERDTRATPYEAPSIFAASFHDMRDAYATRGYFHFDKMRRRMRRQPAAADASRRRAVTPPIMIADADAAAITAPRSFRGAADGAPLVTPRCDYGFLERAAYLRAAPPASAPIYAFMRCCLYAIRRAC